MDTPLGTSKVKAYGPGVDPEKVRERVPTSFKIDATEAGKGPVQVLLTSDKGKFECDTAQRTCKVFIHV